jgi:hypothetical protein
MPSVFNWGWLTSARLSRLGEALRAIPSRSREIRYEVAERSIWRVCGGPYDEIRTLVCVLRFLGLVQADENVVGRTRGGDKIARALAAGDKRMLGLTIVRAGCFHEQARMLLERGSFDVAGNLVCQGKAARTAAPQLVGMLQWWEDVSTFPFVSIPRTLAEELNTVWALLPPRQGPPGRAYEKKAIGDRAEIYSLQWERTKVSDKSQVVWVAQDSDQLGWDIEVRCSVPRRLIEVKGSRNKEVTFFLSDNEWKKAHDPSLQYEIHFWGGIDPNRDPGTEYLHLTAEGYPIILKDLPTRLAQNAFEAKPDRWRLRATKAPDTFDQ